MKRSYTYLKGLLTLALSALTGWMWADVTSSFGVNFTSNANQNITEGAAGFAKEGYAQPTTWTNVSDGSGVAAVNGTLVSWTSRGTWNSGADTSTNDGKLLYNFLDDTVNSGRQKANVTITGLPADKQYAVAVILSGDADNDGFNGKYSPALINGVTYSYVDGALVTGDAAVAATTWGNRRKPGANGPSTPIEGTNVMFVEGLSGSVLSITSAMDSQGVSRLTIAGVQVWITDTAVSAATAPTDVEMISLNFHSAQSGGAVGATTASGLVSAQGWMDLTGANGTASTLKVWNGEKAADATIGLSFKSKEVWGFNTVDAGYNYLRGYLDDGTHDGIDGATIELTSIPFAQYSVIVYAATDTENAYFHSVKINGKWYVGNATQTSIGYATECYDGAKARWGASQNATAVYGTNALRLDGLTSANLTIQAGARSDNARGGIAAIQIVNTGAAVMSDVQQIEGAAEQKISELPEITKPVVELTLPAGATLIVDKLPTTALTVISTGNVTIKVTDLSISQAQLDAMINTAGVAGDVTDNLSETIGYTVGDVTYPLVYIGGTDGWSTAASWAIGTRTNGETTVWIPYAGTVVPGAPGSNTWNLGLIDGDLIGDAITADEDGYKVVNTPTLEGWAFKITVANDVHVKVPTLNKLQGECVIRVDNTSKITVTNKGGGNNADLNKYYIDAENGLVFENMAMPGGTAYLGVAGSITTGTFANNQTIGGVTLALGDSTLTGGRKLITRTLYTYTSGTNFTVADGAVTTDAEGVEATEAITLQNVGDYKFVKTDAAYEVHYVAYAETDELDPVNVWNGAVDSAWETAGNWTVGVPAAGDDVTITVAENTTLTIPEAGVTVGTLIVNGAGTLTLDGGKITAAMVIANANIVAGTGTLALAPMEIAEGTIVTYTATGGDNSEATLPVLTGEGTFSKFGSERLTLVNANDCEPQIIVNEGTLRFKDQTYAKAYNLVAKDGATIQVGTWTGSLTSNSNSLKLEGGSKLWLYNGNSDAGSNVNGTILIDSTVEKPAVIQGNSFGNNGVIAAAIKGNGLLEIQDDDDNFFTISGVIADGDAEGDVLAVKVSTDCGVTFTANNTYTGGTVIAEGVTMTMTNLNTIFGSGNITGAGTVKIAGGTYNGLNLSQFTDANTTILVAEGDTVTGYFNNATWSSAAKMQLDGTLSMTNGFGASKYTFTGPWMGAGTLSLSNANPADVVRIAGDISGFTGNISVSGARAITFCAATTAVNQKYSGKICVHGDYAYAAKVNGTWAAPVVVENRATLAGEGTINNTLTLNAGATLAGAVTVTGDVTVAGALTITHAIKADDVVITCNNAEAVKALLPTAPEGLKYVADGNTIKLAVAKVNVTIPAAPDNTTWYNANGEVVEAGTIQVDPNQEITLTLKADEGYVFADGTNSTTVTVNAGENDATITVPEVETAEAKAMIGETPYLTFAAAFAAAEEGDTITMLAPVTASDIITIDKAITIDGNNQTLTSTATRAINIDCAGEVTIQNLTIVAKERAINIINQAATVTLTGVTATADNNAVMIATTAGAAEVSIVGCNFTGLSVVGVYGAGADVTIANSTIANVDANDDENYGAITVGNTAEYATVEVTNTTITVMGDSKKVYNFAPTATVTGVDEVGVIVAMIGDAGYDTIEEAAQDVKAGQTIKLVTDVTTETPLAIAGTIDLNGKTLTADIAGTIKMNGGTFATTQYVMVGANGLYTSTDAVFTIAANATYDMTVTAGTLTLNVAQWWTLEGQTITIGENAAIVIPAGKTLGINGSTIVVNGTATVAGEVQLLTKTSTVKAAANLNVTTTVAGCEVKYVEGVYTVVESIVIEDVIAATPAAEAIKAAMELAGVTEIDTYTITTKGADANADADAVAAVLEVFDVTPTVDANGELTVAYEFGISAMTNVGEVITITAGVTGAEYRAGVEVAFYADGVEIGTATTTADSTEVSITNIQATDINGKKITVKALK